MSDKAWFNSGGFIDIQGVTITPNTRAKVQALCYYGDGSVQMKNVTIEGNEYSAWASDDDYLISLVGHKVGMGERVMPISNLSDLDELKPFTPYSFKSAIPMDNIPTTIINDTRSIHNDADVAKIETLQAQLDEQRIKLKTITDLLINKGMI